MITLIDIPELVENIVFFCLTKNPQLGENNRCSGEMSSVFLIEEVVIGQTVSEIFVMCIEGEIRERGIGPYC